MGKSCFFSLLFLLVILLFIFRLFASPSSPSSSNEGNKGERNSRRKPRKKTPKQNKKHSLARAALDVAVPYASQRKQFGSRIGDFQLVAAKLADGWTRTQAARALVYAAAAKADAKKEGGSKESEGSSSALSVSGGWGSKGERARECAAAILFSAETATAVALDAIQVLGGNGYINEYPTGLSCFFLRSRDEKKKKRKRAHAPFYLSLSLRKLKNDKKKSKTFRPDPPRRQALRDRSRHLGDQEAGHREGADARGRRGGGREVKGWGTRGGRRGSEGEDTPAVSLSPALPLETGEKTKTVIVSIDL